MDKQELGTTQDYLARYPRICTHIIAESLGYATPLCAAAILQDAKQDRMNYCEWIDAWSNGDPRPAIERAIRNRATHEGYTASYNRASRILRRQMDTGEGPVLASWF